MAEGPPVAYGWRTCDAARAARRDGDAVKFRGERARFTLPR
jgi:hypothetical protein